MDLIGKALEIATEAHKGAKDRGGNDYILHPITVALHCKTNEEKTVALLHDVVEDTAITLDDLRKYFPERIVEAVDAITMRKEEKTARWDYIQRVKRNRIARRVKTEDLKHNSDLSRIPNPTEEDYERAERYKQELAFLKQD